MIAKTLNSSSHSSLFFIIINHKIPAHVGVCLITLRMMQVIKLASSCTHRCVSYNDAGH